MTPEQAEALRQFQEQTLANFNLAGAMLVIIGAALCFVGPGLHDWRFLKRQLKMRDDAHIKSLTAGVAPGTPAWAQAELLLRVHILEARQEATRAEIFAERTGLALLVFGAIAVFCAAFLHWTRTMG